MKSISNSLVLLALLPFTLAHPANPLEARATCPTCSTDPAKNKCDTTTSCINIPPAFGGGDICACRDAYRAATGVQWRLPWTGQEDRVFVAPGTVCDTLCDDWPRRRCTEVSVKSTCA